MEHEELRDEIKQHYNEHFQVLRQDIRMLRGDVKRLLETVSKHSSEIGWIKQGLLWLLGAIATGAVWIINFLLGK